MTDHLTPVHFISHGSPDLAVRSAPASRFLRELCPPAGAKAALVISAHWLTGEPAVGTADRPEQMYDFNGFPDELYRLAYRASGAPEMAREALRLLKPAFPESKDDATRGLDHGAWIPMSLICPEADLPVFQLSVQPRRSARHHYEVGKRLAALREAGVWIVASGNATHNMREWLAGSFTHDSEPPAHTLRFNDWLHGALIARDESALLHWERAPEAHRAHPTPEHLLPLFVALGASSGAGARVERVHRSFDYGVFSMDAYGFC